LTDIWTVRSLKAALDTSEPAKAGEFSARMLEGADPVLLVTMHHHGDLELFVNVSEAQIACSTLLWPCDEQEDQLAFNTFLLKSQKLVPLSNFGIGTVDGRDYYELFGELATSSRLDTVIIELRTLAENAIDAATDLRHAQIPAV